MILFFIFFCIILSVLIAAIFAKKDFSVKRQLLVQSTPTEVFTFIRYLENHRFFSKWVSKKPNIKQVSKGEDGTVGFIQPWVNYEEKAGIGELEIKELIENRSIKIIHHYFKPVKGIGESEIMALPNTNSSTLVIWEYKGHTKYPLNLLTSNINMDKLIGKDLESCLNKLNEKLMSL